MKRVVILILCLFFLQACKEKNIQIEIPDSTGNVEAPQSLPSDVDNAPSKKIPTLQFDRSVFHSVIGWLSDDEILFILMENGEWTVQSYTLSTETWKSIYATKTPIIQGEIHPGKEMILLHTSSNSSSAEVILLHKDGYVLQSLLFESAEIYMNWHPENPNLIAFTTFYEDWTYDTFIYDGTTQNLKTIEVDNPFIKWYDDNRLMVFKWNESSLDGSDLLLYSIKDEVLEETDWNHLLDVQNLGKSMLYITINEQKDLFEYRLEEKETSRVFEWTSPAVSNYSEWVVPNMSVVQPDKLIILQSKKAGNLDEYTDKSVLSSISLDGAKQFGELGDGPIDCSPNGAVCLGGYEKENWIQLDPFQEQAWLELKE
ncbi:YqgU-like beta propeller domain-containing protein [Psychrobacillus lasiicapitis]|uniref:YqgU-like 6-bladed beta-propeller domain-containing protein n=1 Tax=Psychrobacillus lasiicapitis TaxID=1636719 RepID=A0A544TA66_9BACI|nr:hypothetical protein [Psychrobacillus lasiicapitis]TQR14354.1 hypothetical protein FG382_07815 [Psychrobacillus lasiicapitis]GGA32077.1 hypothetical protein GCM10011384_22060 [Psychrobacillus lasiicapitis]